jgi:hypothetical protein
MKRFLLIALSAVLAFSALARDFDPSRFDRVLKVRVEDGLVDYRGLKADPLLFTHYLLLAGRVPEVEFNSWTEPQQLAFLINLYNAATLQLIVEHYPVKSIKDIGSVFKGPWDQPVVPLFRKTITLNELEHGIIRKQYKEPRIHMALVCAAKGCPILRNEAYTAERLDEQLADQSKRYLASPAGLIVNRAKGIAYLSSIFKWYGNDFPSILDFVEKQSGEKITGLKIRYLKYDWSLNEQ